MANPLDGITLLITRPLHQTRSLVEKLQQLGGKTLLFPTIAIEPIVDKKKLLRVIEPFAQYDFAIFVSANAVYFSEDILKTSDSCTLSSQIIAIGQATQKALTAIGYTTVLIPQQHNSEGILALEALQQIKNKKCIIFSGEGKEERTLLEETLLQRGAKITKAIVYTRTIPFSDSAMVKSALAHDKINIIICYSNEALYNLCEMLKSSTPEKLKKIPILAISERITQMMTKLGFSSAPIIAENANDIATIKALLEWRKNYGS